MKLSRERTAYGLVLLCAGAALAIDRLVLGTGLTGAGEAVAGVAPAQGEGASPALDPLPQPEAPAGPTLAGRLEALRPAFAGREPLRVAGAFEIPGSWREALAPAPEAAPLAAGDAELAAERFTARCRIVAVMLGRSGGVVQLSVTGDDGRSRLVAVRPGDEVEGAVLTGVDPGAARFLVGGRTVELRRVSEPRLDGRVRVAPPARRAR